jgi:hypothetical protein
MSRAPVRVIVLVISALAVHSAWAQTAQEKELADLKAEKDRVETQKAILEAQLANAKLTYGTPPTPMTGAVGALENYSGFVSQRRLQVSARAAHRLGEYLSTNPEVKASCAGVLLTDSTSTATNFARAQSTMWSLDRYDDELGKMSLATDGSAAMSLAQIGGLAGTIVSLVGLFQVDYDAKGASVSWPDRWVLLNVASGTSKAMRGTVTLEGATTTDVPVLATQLKELQIKLDGTIDGLTNAKKQEPKHPKVDEWLDRAKAIKVAVDAISEALYKGDDKGIAPIVSMEQYARLLKMEKEGKGKACVAQVFTIDGAAAVFSKSTIFGKGGKVYGNLAANFALAVSDSSGMPISIACASESESSVVKVSDLIGKNGSFAPVTWQGDPRSAQVAAVGCAAAPTATD